LRLQKKRKARKLASASNKNGSTNKEGDALYGDKKDKKEKKDKSQGNNKAKNKSTLLNQYKD